MSRVSYRNGEKRGAIFISEDADVVTMTDQLRDEAENELRRAELMSLANKISDEKDPTLIERLTAFLKHGVMGPREARGILERALPPRIINLPGETEEEQAAQDRMLRLHAQGLPIREIVDRMAMEGYNADTLMLGWDPAVSVAEPMATFRAETTEDLEVGDAVVMDDNGNARRALEGERVVGIALGDGRIRFTGGGFTSWGGPMTMSMNLGSMGYQASIIGGYGGGFPRFRPPARYQYNERFPKEVIDKAMALLAKFMSPDQYKAFMEGSMIELQNKAEDHRIMINRQGKFSILKGPRGEGIMMTSGNVGSFKYPIGDEIAVFLDWFRFRTRELIERWNCGNFSIKDYL